MECQLCGADIEDTDETPTESVCDHFEVEHDLGQ